MSKINKQHNEALDSEVLNNGDMNSQFFDKQELNSQELDTQAKYIASMLDTQSNQLSLRNIKQLENARERAVKAHSQISGVNINSSATLSQTFSWAEHHRLATAGMVLVAITVGFLLMQSMSQTEYSDAFLLGSDLPPEAFVDKGFAPSLNIKQAKI